MNPYQNVLPAKARYTSGSKMMNDPSTNVYRFDPHAGENWLRIDREGHSGVNGDHVFEHQNLMDFYSYLVDDILPDGTSSSLVFTGHKAAFSKMASKYESWAGNRAPSDRPQTSLKIEIQEVMRGGPESGSICCLEAELNGIKGRIARFQRPLGDSRWAGNRRFAVYDNIGRVEEEFCKVGSVIAYLSQDREIKRKFGHTVCKIRDALKEFQDLYNDAYDTAIDLVARWEEFVKNLIVTMMRTCQGWFDAKFGEFLGCQEKWFAANPQQERQIAQSVSHLSTVKQRIDDLLDQAKGLGHWALNQYSG